MNRAAMGTPFLADEKVSMVDISCASHKSVKTSIETRVQGPLALYQNRASFSSDVVWRLVIVARCQHQETENETEIVSFLK